MYLIRDLHLELCKEPTKLNNNNNKNTKWARDMNTFLRRCTNIKPMKRCSPSLGSRETKIKTAMRGLYKLIRMTKMKRLTVPVVGCLVEEQAGMDNGTSTWEKFVCFLAR